MCYPYNREFRRDVKKDEPKETEARPGHRAKAPEFKFWAFPRRSRKFTIEEPATADRTREKV
jgi:hypothetical protein